MAQVTINDLQLNAYCTTKSKNVITKNDKVKTVNLVYFNCTKQAQRDEEGFEKAFQTHAIEGYGYIDSNEDIEVVNWTTDRKKFDEVNTEYHLLQKELVKKAMNS